jgi:hypothetical protein
MTGNAEPILPELNGFALTFLVGAGIRVARQAFRIPMIGGCSRHGN